MYPSMHWAGVCVSQHALGRGCFSQHALGGGGSPREVSATPLPPPVDRMKILPCRNYVTDGKNAANLHFKKNERMKMRQQNQILLKALVLVCCLARRFN